MDSHGEACFAGSAKTAGLFRFLRIESSGNFDERPADKAQLRNSELRAGKRRSEQLTRNRELELCDVKLPRNAVR